MKIFSDSLKLFLMERHERKKLLLFFLCFLLFSSKVFSEARTFEEIGKAFIGDNQTKNDARNLATLEAKRRALEKAGMYVESLTIVQNSVVKKDEILAFTAGVTKTEIISEKAIVEGENYGLEVVAKVTVDTTLLEEKLKTFESDKKLLDQNKSLIARNSELEEDLKKVKEELAKLKNPQEVQEYREEKVAKIEDRILAGQWYQKGTEALYGNPENAIEFFTKVIEIDETDADAYYARHLAYYYEAMLYGKPENIKFFHDKADKDLEKAAGLGHLKAKDDLAHYKKIDSALVTSLQEIDTIQLEAIKASEEWFNKGIEAFSSELYDKARENFTKAIELDPYNADAYSNRGLSYFYKFLYGEAIQDFTKAIELDPAHANAYSNRGLTYFYKGLNDKAIEDCTTAIELNPSDANAYRNRGLAYHAKGSKVKAIKDLKKAADLRDDEARKSLKELYGIKY